MNHREYTHLRVSVRRALHCLSLLLLPAALPKSLPALSRPEPGSRHPGESEPSPQPYLPVLGSPALRFQLAPPPPDLTTRPSAGAPPVPALTPTETAVAQANVAAANSATPVAPAASEPTSSHAQPAAVGATPTPAQPAVPAKPSAAPIIPDDVRPSVRPEDFLPYFQIPGTAAPPLPPSTATYTQSK